MNWKIGFYPFLSIFFNRNKKKEFIYQPKGYISVPNMYNYELDLIKVNKKYF